MSCSLCTPTDLPPPEELDVWAYRGDRSVVILDSEDVSRCTTGAIQGNPGLVVLLDLAADCCPCGNIKQQVRRGEVSISVRA